jgi:hypothetical protein
MPIGVPHFCVITNKSLRLGSTEDVAYRGSVIVGVAVIVGSILRGTGGPLHPYRVASKAPFGGAVDIAERDPLGGGDAGAVLELGGEAGDATGLPGELALDRAEGGLHGVRLPGLLNSLDAVAANAERAGFLEQ